MLLSNNKPHGLGSVGTLCVSFVYSSKLRSYRDSSLHYSASLRVIWTSVLLHIDWVEKQETTEEGTRENLPETGLHETEKTELERWQCVLEFSAVELQGQWAMGNGQLVMGNGQWEAGSACATCHGQWVYEQGTTHKQQRAMNNWQWTITTTLFL